MSVGIAVVGAGLLGARHARVWQELPDSHLVAVIDNDQARADAVASRHSVPAATTLDAVLASGNADAVSIATPDHMHVDLAVAALRAGCHVFVEKPLATSVDGARAIVEAAASSGRIAQVNFSQRWLDDYARVKTVLDSGELGAPQFASSAKRDVVGVPTRMLSWATRTSPVFFMTSHDLDLIRWFLGSEPVSVVAEQTDGVLMAHGVDIHDSVHALVTFGNGVCVTFSTAWMHPGTYPAVAADRLEVVGSDGVLEYSSRRRALEVYSPHSARVVEFTGPGTAAEVDGRLAGAFVESSRHFLDCVSTGRTPTTSAADSLIMIACQEAILASARAGGSRIAVSADAAFSS